MTVGQKVTLFIAIFVLGVNGLGTLVHAAPGGVAQQVPLSGRLVDSTGQVVPDGDYRLRVRIFNDPTGGVQQFEELFDSLTDYGSGSCPEIPVQDGFFRIDMGSCNQLSPTGLKALYNNTAIYTEIALDIDEDGSYEEVFSPRKRLTLSPGAISALQLVSGGSGTSSNTLFIDDQGHCNLRE